MGQIRLEDIEDLSETLESIRGLENIKEKSPAVFYYKSTPFLHFHSKDDKRWADIKSGQNWKSVPIDFKSTKNSRARFFKAVQKMHQDFSTKS